MPWFGVDPIVVASQIVLGLQTITSRQIDLIAAQHLRLRRTAASHRDDDGLVSSIDEGACREPGDGRLPVHDRALLDLVAQPLDLVQSVRDRRSVRGLDAVGVGVRLLERGDALGTDELDAWATRDFAMGRRATAPANGVVRGINRHAELIIATTTGEAAFEAEPTGNPLYEPNAARTSDHDPILIDD